MLEPFAKLVAAKAQSKTVGAIDWQQVLQIVIMVLTSCAVAKSTVRSGDVPAVQRARLLLRVIAVRGIHLDGSNRAVVDTLIEEAIAANKKPTGDASGKDWIELLASEVED